MANFFSYKDKIAFDDNLINFENTLIDSINNKYTIYFEFQNIESSFKKVKDIILILKDKINFDNLYFYNANDFINIILDKPIYLPNNINLFINEWCFIWCNYCDNPNDIQTKLPFKCIKNFLTKYNLWDNINFNILWQWDPLFHPELFEILGFIKSFWWYITFFTWWKSLLYCKDINKLNSLVDEFKVNLSASNYEIYNKTHKNKITKDNFEILIKKFKIISKKSTFITILTRDNIVDLYNFYKFVILLNSKWIEIKKNMHYEDRDILNNDLILNKIKKIFDLIIKNKNINFVTNIFSWYTHYNFLSDFEIKSQTLLNKYIENKIEKLDFNNINTINKCFQFWNSLDITENRTVSLCCHYDDWKISNLDYNWKYYEDKIFLEKYKNFKNSTPDNCKKCPMPIDRYKNYLKFNFVNSL